MVELGEFTALLAVYPTVVRRPRRGVFRLAGRAA
jgi:hypothetical protein